VSDDPASRERRAAERALALDIIGWYVDAFTNVQRQRKGLQPPTEAHVLPLARLILQLRETLQRQGGGDPTGERELALLGEAYHSLHELLNCLPALRDIFAAGGGTAEAGLIDAQLPGLQALAAGLHLDRPPEATRGRQTALVNLWATALLPSVRAALRACRWKGALSVATPTGPVLTILCLALKSIDGREHDAIGVVSGLRRQRRA
jgi:hypothetical protein